MPPKLQVDESFAFLFMCIEASGCKIDFKLVGDATDLQPAAARMRYTRLKKAVEAGHFKGAVLTQPPQTSAQLAAMANPDSRRLAACPGGNRRSRHRNLDSGHNKQFIQYKSPLQASSAEYVDGSEDEDDDGEQDDNDGHDDEQGKGFDHDGPISSTVQVQNKRKAPSSLDNDDSHSLFYPDTSRATQDAKHIKCSESDEEVEEPEPDDDQDNDYTPTKRARLQPRNYVSNTSSKLKLTSGGNTAVDSRLGTNHMAQLQGGDGNMINQQIQRPQIPGSFEEFSQAMRRFYPENRFKQYTSSQMPQAVGVVSRAPQPTPEDFNFAAATGKHPVQLVNRAQLRCTSQPSVNGYPSANTSVIHGAHPQFFSGRNAPQRGRTPTVSSPLPSHCSSAPSSRRHSDYSDNEVSHRPQLPGNELATFQSQVQYHPKYHSQLQTSPFDIQKKASRSRFHPASVFDDFQPPSVSPFAATPVKRNLNINSSRSRSTTVRGSDWDPHERNLDPQLRSIVYSPGPGLSSNKSPTPQTDPSWHHHLTKQHDQTDADHNRQSTQVKAEIETEAEVSNGQYRQQQAEAEAAEALEAMANTNRQEASQSQQSEDATPTDHATSIHEGSNTAIEQGEASANSNN